MYNPDEEHTYFITYRGIYCYKTMSFGLKNVGATYQRLRPYRKNDGGVHEQDVSQVQNGRRSHRTSRTDIRALEKVPNEAQPLKCASGVGMKKFLSFMVNH